MYNFGPQFGPSGIHLKTLNQKTRLDYAYERTLNHTFFFKIKLNLTWPLWT